MFTGRSKRADRRAAGAWHALRADDPREDEGGWPSGGHVLPRARRERIRSARLLARGGGRDVAVHDVHGPRHGHARGLVGGRAARPRPVDDGGGALPSWPAQPVRVAVPRRRRVQRRAGTRLARPRALRGRPGGHRGRRRFLRARREGLSAERDARVRAAAHRRRADRQGSGAIRHGAPPAAAASPTIRFACRQARRSRRSPRQLGPPGARSRTSTRTCCAG